MLKIGLIREGKIPQDNRVALIPEHCKWIHSNMQDIKVFIQHSETRSYIDREYQLAGVEVMEDISECDLLLGIKEVPIENLVPGKNYMFFSHTKKLQRYNQKLIQAIAKEKITLIDYECLEHDDGTRIIGFGFFAGIVGAHNGLMAYGQRTGAFHLDRVGTSRTFQQLVNTYFGLKIPPIKITVTGSGRVAHGLLEIMNLIGIHEVEPDQYLDNKFSYPVYVHLKGADLYRSKKDGSYNRNDFHLNPTDYLCIYDRYLSETDILLNGIYWDKDVPRLFEKDEILKSDFKIQTIADVTDDMYGSVPCNLGDSTIEDPVYGVDKMTFAKTAPYLPGSIDIMAVGNLPNELPRDASRYFGEQLIKYVLPEIIKPTGELIERATIMKEGKLTSAFSYMKDYVEGNL
jgi:alanine dehydrogenase